VLKNRRDVDQGHVELEESGLESPIEVPAITETAPERDAQPEQGVNVALGEAFNYRGSTIDPLAPEPCSWCGFPLAPGESHICAEAITETTPELEAAPGHEETAGARAISPYSPIDENSDEDIFGECSWPEPALPEHSDNAVRDEEKQLERSLELELERELANERELVRREQDWEEAEAWRIYSRYLLEATVAEEEAQMLVAACEVAISLGVRRGKKIRKKPAPTKPCPKCDAIIHIRLRACSNCSATKKRGAPKKTCPCCFEDIHAARKKCDCGYYFGENAGHIHPADEMQ